jgi:hypothetical protein
VGINLVERRPEVNVADVAAQGAFFRRESCLLFFHIRPHLIRLDVAERKVLESLVHHGLGPWPGPKELPENGRDVRPHQPSRAPNAVAFHQQAEDRVALLFAHQVHCEPPSLVSAVR